MEQRVNDLVYDFGQHIVISTSDYHDINYQFSQPYSRDNRYYYHMDNATGKLFVSKALPPAWTFSIYVSFRYNATLTNGTVIEGRDGASAYITAAGKLLLFHLSA